MKLNSILYYLLLVILVSCNKDINQNRVLDVESKQVQRAKEVSRNLNISFLLDLSDRINPEKYPNESMQYYERDVRYIESVSRAFISHLRRKKVRQMKDKIQVFFDPEPRNANINDISKALRYEVTRAKASVNLLDEIREVYSTKPKEIYDLAILDNEYVGSDTWKFFKSKVKDFCIKEEYRNILVIITDGYIYHESTIIREENFTSYLTPQLIRKFKLNDKNWSDRITSESFGFIPATDNLEKLEVLVLGINPSHNNPYEEDIIYKYWNDWLGSMGVQQYIIKTADLPSDMDPLIQDFILNK